MDEFNEWIHINDLKNGLETWCKIDIVDDMKYLKIQYRSKTGKIIDTQIHSVIQIQALKNVIDIYNYKTKYPYVDINIARR